MAVEQSDYQALVECGLSKGYAHDIAHGRRSPSLRKALEIYRKTGRKFGPLRNSTERDIPALERTIGQ